MVQSLDCKACHKQEEKSIGPSYIDVSKRYEKDPNAVSHLVNKIIKGGAGVWGETAMPAHSDLKEEDARQIVSWIQSLSGGGQIKQSLPSKGSLKATLDKAPIDNGVLMISASYTDKGGPNIKPLTANAAVALHNSKMNLRGARDLKGFTTYNAGGNRLLITPKGTGSFNLDSIDLSGITAAELVVVWQVAPQFGYTYELHIDAPDGKKIGEGVVKGISGAKGAQGGTIVKMNLEPVTDGRLHNLYIVSKVNDPKEPASIALQGIQFRAN